ncbi:F420-dependent oxidoreductase [Kribbella qitaiheensis]|uniref:F420-dependent oxidoreductase n=1 Tax=Kribbella qitaiheensis TaxID=1544730 RepID=A0A7G6WV02_9ACTN|nr:Pr6Pr family membrane protein [Kribbella qitaiheensis]QNE17817.1 F420-dependent oxidoreductase [Kribbella qitaiheensis]
MWARLWFAVTAVAMVTGVVITLILAARSEGFGGSPANRALNQFAFFTIQSNLIVGATSLLLAVRLDRPSVTFSVFRLTGLVGITVTFIIFNAILGRHLHLHSWIFVANLLQHIVVPIMSVVGWLVFGPRGLTSRRIAILAVIFPIAYMTFTVIRGPLASNWYPYPFADVSSLGYFRVVINGLLIVSMFLGFSAAATWLDKRLPGGRTVNTPAQPARTRESG